MEDESAARVRAAIKDRAAWFALLYAEFARLLPPAELEAAGRAAITRYGRWKASFDPRPFGARELLERFRDGGGAAVFDAELELEACGGENRVRRCALVEAWRELGLPGQTVELYCDIAMDGDRGRAAFHGLDMRLDETLAAGARFCRITLADKPKEGASQ